MVLEQMGFPSVGALEAVAVPTALKRDGWSSVGAGKAEAAQTLSKVSATPSRRHPCVRGVFWSGEARGPRFRVYFEAREYGETDPWSGEEQDRRDGKSWDCRQHQKGGPHVNFGRLCEGRRLQGFCLRIDARRRYRLALHC